MDTESAYKIDPEVVDEKCYRNLRQKLYRKISDPEIGQKLYGKISDPEIYGKKLTQKWTRPKIAYKKIDLARNCIEK